MVNEIGRRYVNGGSIQVLVKVVLLEGCGDPQDDTKPSLFSNSKSSILGLSNDVSFVSEFNWKVCENRINKIP